MIVDISKLDLSGFFIGEVRNNVDPSNEGKIAVYIPQIMYESEYNEKPYEEDFEVDLDKSFIINADDFENSQLELETANYIWSRPLVYFEDNESNWKFEAKFHNAGSLRIPRIGSHVIVMFFNSDLQKCYYLPYSPTVEGNSIDNFNCINPENYNNPETRVNIDVIRFYWDGTRIEADTNTHELKLTTPNGNYIKLSNNDIEIKGNVHIVGELEVEKSARFKDTIDISKLVTCYDKLQVQDIGYFYNGQAITGNIINNGLSLTSHMHYESTGKLTSSVVNT